MLQSSQPKGLHRGFRGREVSVTTLAAFLAVLAMAALQAPAAFAGSVPCDCESCHGDFHGENWQGCSGCHESPPQTGSHRSHYDSDPLTVLRYGDTTVRSTADAYMFGCGNCHPLDRALHRDGTVQVELYNATAPAGSLKAKNPSDAAYDSNAGTCSNVYCHSGYTVTSSSVVGLPLTYPPNAVPPGYTVNRTYIMDGTCSNLTYEAYTVDAGRSYVTTPPWGTSGSITTCTECHEFPLTTYYPTVYAGVGDSHQWVDDWQWNWRHAYNMIGTPIPCKTCHIATVTQAAGTYWALGEGGAWITAYNPVPVASHAMHVNGTPDVAFDASYVYGSGSRAHTYSLASATYDPATKTCSDVMCHYNPNATAGTLRLWQKTVKWGAPWRDEHESGAECDVCHRYGYLSATCQPAP